MWNRKHNESEKVSGHTYTKNWKIVGVPIKVHPSEYYCNSGGIQCQYLRFKNPDGKTGPFCAWNFEYRGKDKDNGSGKSSKMPLQYDQSQSSCVRKCRFCMNLSEIRWGIDDMHTWENTTTIDNPMNK